MKHCIYCCRIYTEKLPHARCLGFIKVPTTQYKNSPFMVHEMEKTRNHEKYSTIFLFAFKHDMCTIFLLFQLMCATMQQWHWCFVGFVANKKTQFYIQLVYKPHFGTWILLFGPFRLCWQVGKKSGFEFFWATFEGGFFNFLWAKKIFFFLKT